MKAAIFDLDGTLLDSMHVWHSLMEDLIRRMGVSPPSGLLAKLEQMTIAQKVEYVSRHHLPDIPIDTLRLTIDEMIEQKYCTEVLPKPGVIAYLRALRDAGTGTCIATLTDRVPVQTALRCHGMEELFDFVLTVADVGKSKEHPDIYLQAAQRLGADVHSAVVFEDSLYAIQTAKRAGFTVYAVRDAVAEPDWRQIEALSDRFIDDYRELLQAPACALHKQAP